MNRTATTVIELQALPFPSTVTLTGDRDWHKRRDGRWLSDDGDVFTSRDLALISRHAGAPLTVAARSMCAPAPSVAPEGIAMSFEETVAALGRHLLAVQSTRDRALRELANLSPLDVDLDALVAVAKASVPGDLLRALAEAAEGDSDLPHLVSADEQKALNLIRAATLPDRDAYLAVLAQAATIAQHGGISTRRLEALLTFAAIGWASPTVRRRLEEEGISVSTALPGGAHPSAPAPAPSVVPEAAVEAARTAARLHSTTEPPPHENREVCCGECGEAIAYPGCTAEETAERAWRHTYRAALTAALPHLTALPAPEASREDVERLVEQTLGSLADDDGNLGHDTEGRLTDALRARFVITEWTEQCYASLETMRVMLDERDRARIVQHGPQGEDGRQ